MTIDLANIDFAPGQGGGGGKIETSWTVSTVTENGNYTYNASDIGPNYTLSDVTVPVDVHPSTSLSVSYSSNGVYTILGEFNGGQVTVSVPGGGGGGSSDQYIYRNCSVDDSGLTDIGWTQNDINYYKYNSPHYAWRNSEYTVSQADKDLYGVIDASNKDSYKDDVLQYLPVYDMTGVTNYNSYFSDFKELRAIPYIDLSSYTGSCRYMFRRCYKLETIPPLDFSGCSSIANLFEDCYSLVSVPSPLECSRLTTLASMFKNCRNLVELPQLVTGGLQYGDNFCQGCSSLKYAPEMDLSYMLRTRWMFDGCSNLEHISFVSGYFEVAPNTYATLYDLNRCSKMEAMFRDCKLLHFIAMLGFYVSTSANNFKYMFENCSMTSSPVMNYIGGDVTGMYMDCNNLDTFDNVFVLGNFTDCTMMFAGCDNLLHINKSLPTSLCTASKMREMFMRCHRLENIDGIDFSGCDDDPVLFGLENDMSNLTSVTVNGSINVSFPYTFSRCITLDRSSVLSILTAMSNANNADPKDMVFSVGAEDGQDLQDLLTACTAKGWNITGLTVVPVV